MKHRLSAVIAASALLLTGCGKSDKGTDDNGESDVIVTVEAAEETSEVETETDTTAPDEAEEETTEEETEITTEEASEEETTEARAVASSNGFNALFDLKLGSSMEEVFKQTGSSFDNEYVIATNQGTGYIFSSDNDDVFGTGLPVDTITDFTADRELFRCGYNFGRTGGFNLEELYPCTEAELDAAFEKIYSVLESKYGAPTSEDTSLVGVKKCLSWETDEGTIDLLYGVAMWVDDPPEVYEEGINKIILNKVDTEKIYSPDLR
ncbi:MAG: hypothetical protein GXY08_04695 [Ruminococcus sp.]|nr:hypothetical protein [Ruminococcus sp.]